MSAFMADESQMRLFEQTAVGKAAAEVDALRSRAEAAEQRADRLAAALREAIEASAAARRCYDLRQRGLIAAHQAEMEMLDALLRIEDRAREALGGERT